MDKKYLIILITIICICVISIGYIYENFYFYDDIKNFEKELSFANSMELWNKSKIVEDKEEIETTISKMDNVFSFRTDAYYFGKNMSKEIFAMGYLDKRRETTRYVEPKWKDAYTICNSLEKRCIIYTKYADEKIIKDMNKSVVAENITCTQGPYWTPLSSLAAEEGRYTVRKTYYHDKTYYIFGSGPQILLIVDKNGIPLFKIRCALQKTEEDIDYDKRGCDTTQNAKIMIIYKDVNKDIDFGDVSWINEKNISVREFAANC